MRGRARRLGHTQRRPGDGEIGGDIGRQQHADPDAVGARDGRFGVSIGVTIGGMEKSLLGPRNG